ncbi:sce7726 family protein [Pandoraea sputorum]|uniref:sce7726 family protein n=1 Tax=Pandoraea sputorum TaxID=93222 RepID=UPI0012402C63|nr:sce7726 family protein [Pandoraea sputorum]VVE77433.1 hypothetical protein PSP31120_01289 [Pandoraea sputorum]
MATSPRISATRDRDVRDAVKRKVLADHIADPSVLVIDELGLEHGTCRVDIAVVNGSIHGYELKSDSDNLNRLPMQIQVYSRALDKATLVVGEKHLEAAMDMLPEWWGVKASRVGPRGAVHIETARASQLNPDISVFHTAHLLWRNEVIQLLEGMDVPKKVLRSNRASLYGILAELFPADVLRGHIRDALKQRANWRHHAQPL